MQYYFIIFLFCLNIFCVKAQSIDCPKPIIVGKASDSNYQIIYPLGWSEKGNFSYIHQDINVLAGGGGFQYYFIIQNMKTDTTVFEKRFYGDPNEGKYKWEPFSTNIDSIAYKEMAYFDYAFFKTITWPLNGGEISDILALHKIKTTHTFFNNTLDLKKKNITIDERSSFDNHTLTTDYKIILNSKTKGKKTIYHWHCDAKCKALSKNDYPDYRKFVIKGYFKSPFENRIAIIAFREVNGYEEIEEFPFMVGADLENGYNKTLPNKK